MLVIDGKFTPDSVWAVRVGKSIAFSEETANFDLDASVVTNATVIVTSKDNYIDTLKYTERGLYRSMYGHRPEVDTEYTLWADAEGFTPIQAISRAPLLNTDLTDIRPTIDEGYTVRFQVTDLSGENYYYILLRQIGPTCYDPQLGSYLLEDYPNNATDLWWQIL